MTHQDSGRSPDREWFTVQDLEQARLLSDRDSIRYFEPFLDRERSVSEAAAEVDCKVDTMLYRVRKFLSAGLLRISSQQRRAGRPIKYYRSSANAYFVPFSTTPYASLEERLASQMEPFTRALIRASAHLLRQSGRDGRRIYRKDDGVVWTDSAGGPSSPFTVDEEGIPVAYDFSAQLELEFEEAKRLQLELHELFNRYTARERKRGKRYLWSVALIPAAPD